MADSTLTFSDANFEADVLKAEEPVLVDFWAPWCGPCRALAPTVEALAREYAGRVKVGKLNVDDNPETAIRYGVRSIPTLILFRGGTVVDQTIGLTSRQQLAEKLDAALGVEA